jgi:hypothetical protein
MWILSVIRQPLIYCYNQDTEHSTLSHVHLSRGFWVVTPCNVVVGYQSFGGPCYLHLQGYDTM